MTTIKYQQKADPIYSEAGFILGYDTLKDVSVNIASDKLDDYLIGLVEDNTVSNVKVYPA